METVPSRPPLTNHNSHNNIKSRRHSLTFLRRKPTFTTKSARSTNTVGSNATTTPMDAGLGAALTASMLGFLPFLSSAIASKKSPMEPCVASIDTGPLNHFDADPNIIVARERIQNAEAAEKVAKLNLERAHAAVQEAREYIQCLEQQRRRREGEWRGQWAWQIHSDGN